MPVPGRSDSVSMPEMRGTPIEQRKAGPPSGWTAAAVGHVSTLHLAVKVPLPLVLTLTAFVVSHGLASTCYDEAAHSTMWGIVCFGSPLPVSTVVVLTITLSGVAVMLDAGTRAPAGGAAASTAMVRAAETARPEEREDRAGHRLDVDRMVAPVGRGQVGSIQRGRDQPCQYSRVAYPSSRYSRSATGVAVAIATGGPPQWARW